MGKYCSSGSLNTLLQVRQVNFAKYINFKSGLGFMTSNDYANAGPKRRYSHGGQLHLTSQSGKLLCFTVIYQYVSPTKGRNLTKLNHLTAFQSITNVEDDEY